MELKDVPLVLTILRLFMLSASNKWLKAKLMSTLNLLSLLRFILVTQKIFGRILNKFIMLVVPAPLLLYLVIWGLMVPC